MAKIQNIVHITQTDYDTLIANGSVTITDTRGVSTTHTYDANNLYVVEEDRSGTVLGVTSTSGVSGTFKDEDYYYFEAYRGDYPSVASFGVVHIDSYSTSTKPIVVISSHSNANTSSQLSDNKLIRLVMYKTSTNTYNVRIQTSTSSFSSFTGSTNYWLRYWRLNICPN